MPGNWLAAMPLFGPPSTIVMGTPASTGLTGPRWRSTVLHEHVHQWQAALPDYYARVAALDLAGGDETGMWMLEFRFPLCRSGGRRRPRRRVARARRRSGRARHAGLLARGWPIISRLRRAFAAAAGARNWRYFEFQLWQEGVARWTEIAISRALARSGDAGRGRRL